MTTDVEPRSGSDRSVYGSETKSTEPDDWSNHPRSLTIGFIAFFYFVYAIFKLDDDEMDEMDTIYHVKRGIKYACSFFLVYCVLQLRDGHFIRPHPSFWRLVTGCFILYEVLLIIIAFLPKRNALQVIHYLDPTIPETLSANVARSYASDCRVYTPEDPENSFRNVYETMFDLFVPMHFFGWMIGAVMVRNYLICWTISILFEFYEMTFAHWMANFNECWWDHIFLDVLICNAFGIYLGMQICHYFEMKEFNWVGMREIPNFKGKAKRMVLQLFPKEWLVYDWAVLQSLNRFIRVMLMIILLSVMMLNSFFLKYIFDVPPSSVLNVYRLLIWYSAGSYAVAEFYIFCTRKSATKLGPRAWLGIGVVLTEVCVILRHRNGYFQEPFPEAVKMTWGIVSIVFVLGVTTYFSCCHREDSSSIAMKHELKDKQKQKKKQN